MALGSAGRLSGFFLLAMDNVRTMCYAVAWVRRIIQVLREALSYSFCSCDHLMSTVHRYVLAQTEDISG